MREIVLIGSEEFVKDNLDFIMKEALKLAKKISPNAHIKEANDHFYPCKKNEIKIKVQRMNGLKKELVIPMDNEDIAVASFNFHNYHFSKTFDFDDDGKIVSGCVGFGIERWIAACSEYGVGIEKF